MLNTININLKTDIKTDNPTSLPIKLMSQDKNNNQFILRFTNGGESVTLDDSYTVEIMTKFTKSGTSRLTTAKVRHGYVTWEFDTDYITQDETVYNYVYVRKSGILVVSADSNAFYFEVGLSEIDKDAGRVAETYDENYQKHLDEFKENVNLEAIAQAEQAREEAEGQRESAESSRVSAESSRVSAEAQRKTDHANRSAEFDGKADKVVIKNLIENGDFSNGLSGWVGPFNGSLIDGVVTGTHDSSAGFNFIYKTLSSNSAITGEIIYVATRLKNSGEIIIGQNSGANTSVPVNNDFTIVSNRVTRNSADGFTFFIRGNGVTISLDWVMDFNLTRIFGAGNEPTKEEMDRLIEITGYIDGEYALNNKEMLGHLMKGIGEKADKKQEDWITATLMNGATGDVQFRKNQFGRVEFRGIVTSVQGVGIFALPVGYRPLKQFRALAKVANSTNDARSILFQTAGAVYFEQPSGTSEVYFDAISFSTN